MTESPSPQSSQRIVAIDVLRGLAIFGMGLSGMVPFTGLPAWMYHAQLPPPTRQFNDHVFGITWVDLVFPFFLFTMGASIPIALSKRLNGGHSAKSIAFGAFWRGLMLCVYALIGDQLRPYVIQDDPSKKTLLLGVWGALLLFAFLGRFPQSWSKKLRVALPIAALALAVATISFITYPDGRTGFSNDRNDIILLVLGNVAISGAILWLLTRCRRPARMALIAGLAVLFLTKDSPGIGSAIWNFDPLRWIWHLVTGGSFDQFQLKRYIPVLYHFEYHKYLLIVLPGTICGDILIENREGRPEGEVRTAYSIVFLTVLSIVIACWGLLQRQVGLTTALEAIVGSAIAYLAARDRSAYGSSIGRLANWGLGLLILGLMAEPLGGGIRKDEATLSYFLVTSGLAFQAIYALTVAAEGLGWKPGAIAKAGENPILAYVTITNIVPAAFGLTVIGPWISGLWMGAWPQATLAFIKNVFMTYLAAACSKAKFYLRA